MSKAILDHRAGACLKKQKARDAAPTPHGASRTLGKRCTMEQHAQPREEFGEMHTGSCREGSPGPPPVMDLSEPQFLFL